MKANCLSVALLASLALHGVEIPGKNEPLTIPAGETLTIDNGNIDAFLNVKSVHFSDESSKLFFNNVTKTPMTLSMPFTGNGQVRMEGQKYNDQVRIESDNSGFHGSFSFSNRYVRVMSLAGLGSGCPVAFTNVSDKKDGCLRFEAAGEYNVPVTLYAGAHYGLYYVNEAVTNKGTLRASHNSSLVGPGCHAGDILLEGGLYTVGMIKILPGSTVSGLPSSSSHVVYVDGGTLTEFGCDFEGITGFNIYRDTAKMLAANIFPDTMRLQFGVGYAKSGKLDLNGFDQKCVGLNLALNQENVANTWISSPLDKPATFTLLDQNVHGLTYWGSIDNGASFDFSSSQNYKLTLNGGDNTTRGAIIVRSGRLELGSLAKFEYLSRLAVSGGVVYVNTSDINPSMVEVEVSGSGKLDIGEGVELKAYCASFNGVYLNAGTYTKSSPEASSFIQGAGTLTVLNSEPPVRTGKVYNFTGSSGSSLSDASNWEGGVAPDLANGESILRFAKEDVVSVTIDGEIDVYGIEIANNNGFLLNGGEGSKVLLGFGGIVATNTLSGKSVATNVIDVAIELKAAPQTWVVGATNTCLSLEKPLSGPAFDAALTIDAKGAVLLYADNSGLFTPVVFKNLDVFYAPRVFHPKALGSPTRPVTFIGSNPVFQNKYNSCVFTNETPLRIFSKKTIDSYGRYINDSTEAQYPLYLTGPVTVFNDVDNGQVNMYSRGNVHFAGGLYQDSPLGASFCFRMSGGNNWFEGVPVDFPNGLVVDYESLLHIAAQGNNWSTLHYYAAKIECHNEGVLAPEGTLKAGYSSAAYFRIPAGRLNLNGYDQTIKRFTLGWDPKSTNYVNNRGYFYEGYTIVTSSVPATLRINSDNSDIVSVKVTGAAGIHFGGTGTLVFTNFPSTTCGELRVSSGRVELKEGSGWTHTTNVVVSGGTLYVGPETGAFAFGEEQDSSRAEFSFAEGGVLEIAQGERATVRSLTSFNESGVVKYYMPGVYGGPDCTVPGAIRLESISGGGVLFVKSTLKPSTLLVIK